MSRQPKQEILVVEDYHPETGQWQKMDVELPQHVKCIRGKPKAKKKDEAEEDGAKKGKGKKAKARKSETKEDETKKTEVPWSITLGYHEVRCVLRQRPGARIQAVAPWLPGSGRQSTGTHFKPDAIQWACHMMGEVHLRNLYRGPEGEPTADSGLRLSDAARLLRSKKLLPGKEGSKTWRAYDLVLDLARAAWTDDPKLSAISNRHVREMFEARSEEHGESVFQWPPHFDNRKALSRVAPRTVQKQLEDLRTLLRKLVGETDTQGRLFVTEPPMAGLKLGDYKSTRRDVAGPMRYPSVLRHADEATELLRTRGYAYQERRSYKGEMPLRNRRQVLPDVVPGQFRMLLVLQFGHPTRPKAIRNLRRADVARKHEEVVGLIHSLDLKAPDDEVPVEWARHWPDGAIAYRREHSKNKTERLVPLSHDLALEVDRYLEKRDGWLANRRLESPWLFPSPRDPLQPISGKDAGYLIAMGERVARERLKEAGNDPDLLVPIFKGTRWYAYRRFWKTNRNAMGWEGNRNAAYVGDWTTKTGQIADTVYAQMAPHLLLAVVEGKTLVEAIQDHDAVREAKKAARLRPDVDDDDEG